jgi:hypothetical protein
MTAVNHRLLPMTTTTPSISRLARKELEMRDSSRLKITPYCHTVMVPSKKALEGVLCIIVVTLVIQPTKLSHIIVAFESAAYIIQASLTKGQPLVENLTLRRGDEDISNVGCYLSYSNLSVSLLMSTQDHKVKVT